MIDTHVFLWAVGRDSRLSARHSAIIDARQDLAISAASIWEIAIKRATGKLRVDGDLLDIIRSRFIRIIPVNEHHAMRAGSLPPHHRDPFDRLLVAQAQVEGLALLSSDTRLALYDVTLI